jgi:phosphate-selective porin OprO/OprP
LKSWDKYEEKNAERREKEEKTGTRQNMSHNRHLPIALLLMTCSPIALLAAPDPPLAGTNEQEKSEQGIRYGEKGLEFGTEDDSTFLWFGIRLQGRYDSLPGSLSSAADLDGSDADNWDLKRGRIKSGGHFFSKAIQIYSEYDFTTDTLLDYKLTLRPSDNYGFRFGQWKSEFNRERIDSSGKQQFVDRSLSNYWFTLDRQTGVGASARLWPGQSFDSSVWLEYLSGRGRGVGFDSDYGLGMLRWQWNPNGEVLGFGQSDLERSKQAISGVSLVAAHGKSPFTRFSSSGGGQIPGLDSGDYRITQAMLETAYRWRGVSWQQELHWKDLKHLGSGEHRSLLGGYAQVGAFPSEFSAGIPDPLELTARVAWVDPDTSMSSDQQWEWMIGANWYFKGHRSKLSADLAYLDFDDPVTQSNSAWRFRLQWDVSF